MFGARYGIGTMKPIFTVHAGEYLVGEHVESKFRRLNVWVPTKDTGIDLLVTDKGNKKAVSIQVKFSKDFLTTNKSDVLKEGLKAIGWWSLKRKKIQVSKADYWVFVLYASGQKKFDFIIISPRELLRRLGRIHKRKDEIVQIYFSVTGKGRCWETRGLPISDQQEIAKGKFRKNGQRDFTQYLNNWKPVIAPLR
jgi:hypothetical protein